MVNNRNLQPYIWILVSGFVFSWMAILTVVSGKATNWQIVAIARCAIPLVLIAAWAKWDGAKLVYVGSRVLWMRSLAGSVSLVGTFYLLANTESTNLQITDIYAICNIFPIWVALLSWPMLGRFPPGSVWASIVSSVAGVMLIRGASPQTDNAAVLLIVGISIFTALAMMGLNQLKHLDPRAVVVHFSGTALFVALACTLIFPWKAPEEDFTLTTVAQLLGIGVTASIGQFFLTKAFTAGDPSRMSVASLSQFVFVLVLDVLILEHMLDWRKMIGIPLILGPTLWLMLRRVKKSVLAAPVPQPEQAPPVADLAICADSAAGSDSK